MRAVELAKVAAAAEALRLRRIARRQALRAAYGVVAGVFAIAALVVLHVVIWSLLLLLMSPLLASVVLLAIDVVGMIVFGMMALKSTSDPVEAEAHQIRQQALIEMRQSLTVMSMVASVAGTAVRTGMRRGARRGLTSALVDGALRLVRR